MSAPPAATTAQAPPAQATAPARAQVDTTPAPPVSRPSGLSIPFVRGQLLLDFGRLDSTYHRQDLVLEIDNQNTVAAATYQQLEQLCPIALPMTQDDFVQMWKTLVLKRVQDVYEQEKHRRAPQFVRVMQNIPVPAPLADLLYSLGQHHSRALGTIFDMTPPPQPAQPPRWWELDPMILDHWCLLMGRMSTIFMMKEFPSKSEFKDRAIGMTSILDQGETRSVRSLTNEPTPADGFIRFIHDELFVVPLPYNNSQLRIVEGLERSSILRTYVGSYVTGTNA